MVTGQGVNQNWHVDIILEVFQRGEEIEEIFKDGSFN